MLPSNTSFFGGETHFFAEPAVCRPDRMEFNQLKSSFRVHFLSMVYKCQFTHTHSQGCGPWPIHIPQSAARSSVTALDTPYDTRLLFFSTKGIVSS
jgi:hypothetical protein